MAHNRDESSNGDSRGIDRRNYLKTAGTVVGASIVGATAVTGTALGASSTVDLGEKGLTTGDVIDSYLDKYFESGTVVQIPAGTYTWRGTGFGGKYRDAGVVGDGDVTFEFVDDYWNDTILAVGGGDVRFENITVRGAVDSDGNKSRLRFDCRHPDSTITLDNFNLPDGDVGRGRAIGIYVGKAHEGTVHLNNCHIERWPNNGLYAGPYGKRDGGGGKVVVENCYFKDNNIDAIRLGGDGDVVRNCVIIQDDVPAFTNGAKSGRGIRVRYPRGDVTIENVHITTSASKPIVVPDRADGPNGHVENVYIQNDTGATAIYIDGGHWTGNNIHVTGDGNRNLAGFDSVSNVYTGSNAQSPATSLSDVDGSSGDGAVGSPDPIDGGEPSLDHTLTIDGTSDDAKEYTLTVSEELRAGGDLNPDDSVDGTTADGVMYAGSDSYEFSGELTEFSVDAPDDVTVSVDGERIDHTTDSEYPNTLRIDGSTDREKSYSFAVSGDVRRGSDLNPDDSIDGATAEGKMYWGTDTYEFSGDITEFDVNAPEEVTITVNGTEIDPTEFGADPLPNRLVIDGSSFEEPASYEFEVSGDLAKSASLGDFEADDEITGSRVTGTIDDDVDGVRFSGNLVSMQVDGGATITVENREE